MELQLKIVGLALIVLAAIHVIFPRYFNWKTELRQLSLINRQMMQVHTLFIAVTVFLMGVLCWTSAADLLHTALGRRICLGIALFWALRAGVQFFGYSSELWRGKLFETAVHILFSVTWIYLTVLFWMAANA